MTTFPGTPGDDTHSGIEDLMYGGAGNDVLTGTKASGEQDFYGGKGDDTLITSQSVGATGKLYGGSGNDQLKGSGGSDSLYGGKGDDQLQGLDGNDLLKGGLGADTFAFSTALDKHGNVDLIVDFNHADGDKIALAKPGLSPTGPFSDIGPTFDKSEFVKGTKALDADDRVIYNQHNGKLFYDHDGVGGDAKVLFAVIENHAKLHFGDFTYQA